MSENIEKCISQFPKSNRDLFCLTKLIKQHILTFEKLKPEDYGLIFFCQDFIRHFMDLNK